MGWNPQDRFRPMPLPPPPFPGQVVKAVRAVAESISPVSINPNSEGPSPGYKPGNVCARQGAHAHGPSHPGCPVFLPLIGVTAGFLVPPPCCIFLFLSFFNLLCVHLVVEPDEPEQVGL